MNIYQEIQNILESGGTGVLATLVSRSGPGARAVGSKMLITDQGKSTGSLGGGIVDAAVLQRAQQILLTGEPVLIKVEPDQDGDDVCGSTVQVFLERISSGPAVVIIGAGHVGRAVAVIAGQAGFQVAIADDRSPAETGTEHIRCSPADFFQDLSVFNETFIVICTRSHALDFDVLQQALGTRAGYIGLLGSKRKKDSFFTRLSDAGCDEKDLARIITPVGLDIGAQTPQEIGVSIVAQLITLLHDRNTVNIC